MMPQAVHDQRMEALKIANKTRIANAKTIAAIRALPKEDAKDFVASMVENPGRHIGALPIARLLTAIPSVGGRRVESLLRSVDVRSPSRRVDELTARQRTQLAVMVRTATSFPNT